MFTQLNAVFDKCFTTFLESRVCFFISLFYKYFVSLSVCQLWVVKGIQWSMKTLLYSDKHLRKQLMTKFDQKKGRKP